MQGKRAIRIKRETGTNRVTIPLPGGIRRESRKDAIHSYRRVLELFPLERQLDELAKRRLSRLE